MLLSYQQCRQFDKIAIEEYGIPGIVLMENAGAGCAREIHQRFPDTAVAILCGGGNNGGDGFVIARHLHNFEMPVTVIILSEPNSLKGDAKTNFHIIEKMDIPIRVANRQWTEEEFAKHVPVCERMLFVDAMLGTGVQGTLKEPYLSAVAHANAIKCKRVAIDIPTGFDSDSNGFKADLTLTFVGKKLGFDKPNAASHLGEIKVLDIGAPNAIYSRL